MPGNVRRRGNRWQASVEVPRTEGKRLRIYSSFKTEREANVWISDRYISVAVGTFVPRSAMTLAEVYSDYAALRMQAASTIQAYDSYSERMITTFGRVALQGISTPMLERFIASLVKAERLDGRPGRLSRRAIDHNIRQVKAFFAWANKRKYVERNVAADIPRLARVRSHAMVILTVPETKVMLSAAAGSPLEAGLWLAAFGGLRRGEVLGLPWRNVDLVRRYLTVHDSFSMTPDGPELKDSKSDSSSRTIKLASKAVQALERVRSRQLETYGFLPDYVCTLPTAARQWHPNKFSNAFSDFLSRSGMRHMRFHDLRHTHAAQLIAAGAHIKTISARLGHSKIYITMDLYGHLMPGVEDGAVSMLEALYDEPGDERPPTAA